MWVLGLLFSLTSTGVTDCTKWILPSKQRCGKTISCFETFFTSTLTILVLPLFSVNKLSETNSPKGSSEFSLYSKSTGVSFAVGPWFNRQRTFEVWPCLISLFCSFIFNKQRSSSSFSLIKSVKVDTFVEAIVGNIPRGDSADTHTGGSVQEIFRQLKNIISASLQPKNITSFYT